ncbi:NitT/TauT family transport system ATP-binding protein [Lachnospiraceae bacterium XBB2008]|nr:NitT/TauT family transport system ATP-binding protein [Lachnospiraceae bacterium XBB2008]
MSEYSLRIESLSKAYFNDTESSIILKNINLSVRKNEFLCILGPSGCGKTTLLRCIAGFEEHTGQIYVNDSLCTVPGMDRIMVFQDFNQLFPWKTVLQNILFPLKRKGINSTAERKEIAREALSKVKLSDYESYYPHQLSGGMKQRVAIAKALALKPDIILMDEPFAALDAMTRRELQNEMLTISQEESSTIIFVTHNIQEALILGTRNIVLQKGGEIILDEENSLTKPVTPNSEGYGAAWQRLRDAIYLSC